MIDTAPPRLDLAALRRALDAADPDGEAALNALLYAGAALMMSAVLLVITSPAVVAIVLAFVPWLVLAAAGWLWVQPALRKQRKAAQLRGRQAEHARALAADVLLDDDATADQRKAAARVMLESNEP